MHAWSGTWVANLKESRRDPNHQFQCATTATVSVNFSTVNAATLAIMNDRDVNVQPQPGDRVKIVVEG